MVIEMNCAHLQANQYNNDWAGGVNLTFMHMLSPKHWYRFQQSK